MYKFFYYSYFNNQIINSHTFYLQQTYDLDPGHKAKLLKDAGKMHRNWRTNMSKFYIFDYLEENPTDCPPPLPFGFESNVTPDQWSEFVASRLSEEWRSKREKMQNYRKMNVYDHHCSRGGYIRIEEMIMEESGKSLREIDRADLWSKGRTNSQGELSGEAAQVQKNIVSVYF